MNAVKGAAIILVGITIGFTVVWLRPRGFPSDNRAEVAERIADLDQRLSRLERRVSEVVAYSPTDTWLKGDQLAAPVSELHGQITSLPPAIPTPERPASSRPDAPQPAEDVIARSGGELRSPTGSSSARELEDVVTAVVTSLAPKYLEEQVAQLYTAQKQADAEAQQEADARQRETMQTRRLAALLSDLQAFVPALSPAQSEEVGQVIREQWEVMAALRQQASEQGTFITSGEILQDARALTDAKLFTILSPPQLDGFRLWRETRFGTPANVSGQ